MPPAMPPSVEDAMRAMPLGARDTFSVVVNIRHAHVFFDADVYIRLRQPLMFFLRRREIFLCYYHGFRRVLR